MDLRDATNDIDADIYNFYKFFSDRAMCIIYFLKGLKVQISILKLNCKLLFLGIDRGAVLKFFIPGPEKSKREG